MLFWSFDRHLNIILTGTESQTVTLNREAGLQLKETFSVYILHSSFKNKNQVIIVIAGHLERQE